MTENLPATESVAAPTGWNATIKPCLRKIPLLVSMYRKIATRSRRQQVVAEPETTHLNMLQTFPLYTPCSAGSYADKAALAIEGINQVFPFLEALVENTRGASAAIKRIEDFGSSEESLPAINDLKALLDHHGSDKANSHNYHYLYGSILAKKDAVRHIFEIGLGTNNTDVVSNMGHSGRPGASLRAFRDFCPHARVYGADVDPRILFEEERIETFFADQTKPESLDQILARIPRDFDLVIDDGLHAPNANIASLNFALKIIRKGGWAVIEDIGPDAISVWRTVSAILPEQYEAHLISSALATVFAVQRIR